MSEHDPETHKDLEALLLDYIRRYGLTEAARNYYFPSSEEDSSRRAASNNMKLQDAPITES